MASSPLTTQWIGCNPSNFNGGRGGYNVNGIVIHHAVCLNIGAMDAVFQRYGYGGSAHYGVWGNTVHQYVDENDTAWHCSNYWGNQNTIGIECVNSALGGDYPVADDTLEMLIRLVADIAKRYNLGRLYVNPSEDCPKISGHRDWYGAATACPGDYLYARLQYIADRANDINYPPEPPKREIKWHDVPTTTMMVDGVTHLYNLETDEQICEVSGEVTFVQMTEDNGWVRTQYSKDKNLNNGIAYHRLVPIPEPTPEPATVSGMRIPVSPLLHGCHQCGLNYLVRLSQRIQQRLRHSDGHHSIVRILAVIREHREVLRLFAPVKLIGSTNHVTQDSSKHC